MCHRIGQNTLSADRAGDTLDATSTSETTDGGFGDTLDAIVEDLVATYRATVSETLRNSSAAATKKINRPGRSFPPLSLCDVV